LGLRWKRKKERKGVVDANLLTVHFRIWVCDTVLDAWSAVDLVIAHYAIKRVHSTVVSRAAIDDVIAFVTRTISPQSV
jgi:hypothetical protein